MVGTLRPGAWTNSTNPRPTRIKIPFSSPISSAVAVKSKGFVRNRLSHKRL